ncbi:hypothetical protein AVEN_25102-1 [Araneus ventricosus]|uniref:Uncharacterized protein n=1 Tax=Araneus ventricosus TaxID=182803 RepID=A0A4Y2JGE1_ARAVE|nr:hypothetical protein AVEN_25102-1 [Araneus ventricosus]
MKVGRRQHLEFILCFDPCSSTLQPPEEKDGADGRTLWEIKGKDSPAPRRALPGLPNGFTIVSSVPRGTLPDFMGPDFGPEDVPDKRF